MTLSRSEEQRKVPRLSLMKWIFLIAGFVLFVMVSFYLYVRSSDSEYRSAQSHAIRMAKDQGGLKSVSDAISHTWDETVWIVTGKDADGETWMIFERSSEIVREKLSENLSQKQMLAKFELQHNTKPIRIIPGWFKDQPAWEIRYWSNREEKHQSLDFYSLSDGTLLKTYILSS